MRPSPSVSPFDVAVSPQENARSALAPDVAAQDAACRRQIERQHDRLLDEINHRVRNTLATVQAIAMQTLKGADAPARDAFLARLFALSSQHDLLTLGNWEGASLEGVVRRALQPWTLAGTDRFIVAGPPVQLTPKRALALGMAFHELATNAARHGALSNDIGQVEVRWHLSGDRKRVALAWRETGGPPITTAVATAAPQGFGLRLIEQGVAHEIGGEVELRLGRDGLVCAWEMPL